ncbi:ATP-binding protein [Streptomyces ruber]|uniref:ATP-binding protein n=2 Tax=Streptomyces TaxID=1883 RepID=A0A918BKJ4_9ACTN|nr:ATP-binding protein [Streptomyces ruber]GGQ75825.1 ATP-binding protein [Streptomyces ruber]
MEPVPLDEGRTASTPGRPHVAAALDGDGACIAKARRLADDFLERVQDEHEVPVSTRAGEVTRLVVSELVTNARKYAPGPVLLELCLTGELVEVVVWDSDPVLPVARAADPGRVGQHGLEIVMALSHSFETRQEPVGKRVIARIALGDEEAGRASGRRSA